MVYMAAANPNPPRILSSHPPCPVTSHTSSDPLHCSDKLLPVLAHAHLESGTSGTVQAFLPVFLSARAVVPKLLSRDLSGESEAGHFPLKDIDLLQWQLQCCQGAF